MHGDGLLSVLGSMGRGEDFVERDDRQSVDGGPYLALGELVDEVDGAPGRFRLEADLVELRYPVRRELECLARPLVDAWLLALPVADLNELIGLALELIQPSNHASVRAVRESDEVVGSEEGIAAQPLQKLKVAGHIRTGADDVSVFGNGVRCPA